MACVYVLYSRLIDRHYIGSTEDPEERLKKHLTGYYPKGYTTKASDWEIFMLINCSSRTQARSIEAHIKRMKSVKYIHNLILYPQMVLRLLEKYQERGRSR